MWCSPSSDHGLDRLSRRMVLVTRRTWREMHVKAVRLVVTAISLSTRMPSEAVRQRSAVMQRLGVPHKLAAFGGDDRRDDGDRASEFIKSRGNCFL